MRLYMCISNVVLGGRGDAAWASFALHHACNPSDVNREEDIKKTKNQH